MTTVEWILTELPDPRILSRKLYRPGCTSLSLLEMDIPGVFFDKLGTLSEALVLVVRPAQVAQRENITVADLQERVRFRESCGKGNFCPTQAFSRCCGFEGDRRRDDRSSSANRLHVWCPW